MSLEFAILKSLPSESRAFIYLMIDFFFFFLSSGFPVRAPGLVYILIHTCNTGARAVRL